MIEKYYSEVESIDPKECSVIMAELRNGENGKMYFDMKETSNRLSLCMMITFIIDALAVKIGVPYRKAESLVHETHEIMESEKLIQDIISKVKEGEV